MDRLQDILADLSYHCMAQTGQEQNLVVVLPRAVVDKFTLSFIPKEKIKTANPTGQIRTLHLHGGTVEIVADDEMS